MDVQITPVGSEKFPTIAIRPKNSVLNCLKITSTFDVNRPTWEDALRHILVKKIEN